MKSIQSWLNAHPDFEKGIKNNAISLLNSIQNMMHETVISQYPFVSITGALNKLTKVNQFGTESLLYYVVWVKKCNVMKTHLNKSVLD